MKANGSQKKIVSAQVERETVTRLERLAAQQERTLSAEIRLALRAYVDRQPETHRHKPQEVAA